MKVLRQDATIYADRINALIAAGWPVCRYPVDWVYFGIISVAGRSHDYGICQMKPGIWLVEVALGRGRDEQWNTWYGNQLFAYALCTAKEINRLIGRRSGCLSFTSNLDVSDSKKVKEVARELPRIAALMIAWELEL